MKLVITFFVTIAGFLLVSFLLAWPVQLLWNGCLVGAIDGVQPVTWLQAWGLQFLLHMLFGSKTTVNKD